MKWRAMAKPVKGGIPAASLDAKLGLPSRFEVVDIPDKDKGVRCQLRHIWYGIQSISLDSCPSLCNWSAPGPAAV